MLLFKSGAFRIMGKNEVDELDIYLILSKFSNVVPDIFIQTMTASCNYNRKIILNKLANEPHTHYTAEFFPAVHINKFKPLHINVFSSGRITICGIKDLSVCDSIKVYLDDMLCKYFVQ